MNKISLVALLSAAILTDGCAGKQTSTVAAPAPVAANPIVTPAFSLAAKVVSVNIAGRFVVLSFPSGGLPKLQQTLFLYRTGLKVAEVKVSGPQEETNIVADLISGEAQAGDTVRDQ
jgi:hypothetical protein